MILSIVAALELETGALEVLNDTSNLNPFLLLFFLFLFVAIPALYCLLSPFSFTFIGVLYYHRIFFVMCKNLISRLQVRLIYSMALYIPLHTPQCPI